MKIYNILAIGLLLIVMQVHATQSNIKKLAAKRPAPTTVAAIDQEAHVEQGHAASKKVQLSELGSLEELDEAEVKEQAAQAPESYKLVLPDGQSLDFDAKLLEQSKLLASQIKFFATMGRKHENVIPITQYITKLTNAGEQVSLQDLHAILSVISEHADNQSEALEKLLNTAFLTFPRRINLLHVAGYLGIEPLFQYAIQAVGESFAEQAHASYKKAIAQLPDEWQVQITARAVGNDPLIMNFLSSHSHPLLMPGPIDRATSVAWSPDGRQLASGFLGSTIKIWDATTGDLVRTLQGNGGPVLSVAWSPDGTQLASGSNGVIKIWDITTGVLVHTLESREGWIYSVAWSPDGMHLASGSNGVIKIWDITTEAEVTISTGGVGVHSIAWSPDGSRLASGDTDYKIKIWDVATRSLMHMLNGHAGSVNSVAWSPDGRQLASGSKDTTIKIWDVATRALVRTLEGHADSVLSVSWSPDGKQLASGDGKQLASGSSGDIKIWDPATGLEHPFKIRKVQGKAVAWSPDSRRLANGSTDGVVGIYDIFPAWLTIAQMDLLKKMIQEKRSGALPAEVVTYASLPDGWKALLTKAFGQG